MENAAIAKIILKTYSSLFICNALQEMSTLLLSEDVISLHGSEISSARLLLTCWFKVWQIFYHMKNLYKFTVRWKGLLVSFDAEFHKMLTIPFIW